MREKLNSNPLAQVAVIGVLLVAVAVFFMSSMGGKGEEEATETSTSATVTGPEGSATVTVTTEGQPPAAGAVEPPPGALAAAAPPPPAAVTSAFDAGRTVVLLFVRRGGIDDRMVVPAVAHLSSLGGVATFVVPADRIARYAAIAQGVDVDRVPALVVLRPKRVDSAKPSASVHYGFQSPQSVVQAVVDAGYQGRTLDYHP